MANCVDPDQTVPIGAVCSGSTLFASILNLSVMLGNYLQQTNSVDNIFRCIFFLALYGLTFYNFNKYLYVIRSSPNFYTVNLQHSSHKHVFTSRMKNIHIAFLYQCSLTHFYVKSSNLIQFECQQKESSPNPIYMCLTQDRRSAVSSLTGVASLCCVLEQEH